MKTIASGIEIEATNTPYPKKTLPNGWLWALFTASVLAACVCYYYTITFSIDIFGVPAIIFTIMAFASCPLNRNKNNDNSFVDKAQKELNKTHDPIYKAILNGFIKSSPLISEIKNIDYSIQEKESILLKGRNDKLNLELSKEKSQKEQLLERLKEVQYNVTDDIDETKLQLFNKLCESFIDVDKSNKKWYYKERIQNIQKKSFATSLISRTDAKTYMGTFNHIFAGENVPIFSNGSSHIIIYPKFIISAKSQVDFKIYTYENVHINMGYINFVESKREAKDAMFVQYTWDKVNKNGEPDKRYANNQRHEVYQYYEVTINLSDKEEHTFIISNTDAAKEFGKQLYNYIGNDSNKKDIKSFFSSINQENSNNYFEDACKAANKLYSHVKSMSENADIIKVFDNHEETNAFNQLELKGLDNRVGICFIGDIIKCYNGLGHKMDPSTKEGLAMASLILRIIANDQINVYENEQLMRSKGGEIGANFFHSYSKAIDFKLDKEKLIMVYLLRSENVENEIIDKYVTLIYRFMNIIAKSDNTISPKESVWLASIMKNCQKDNNIETPKKACKKSAPKNTEKALQNLIGLSAVKEEVRKLTNLLKIQKTRQEKGLANAPISYHCVFTGNPGTGKTTVARIVAEIYKNLGIIKKGHIIETDRSGLVAEYVGQTAVKTNKIIDEALDGVLFIDEAYSLIQGGTSDYGTEAISTLLKRMEDDRDRLVVILAGYSNEMKKFIDSNPGLQSRFNRYIEFADYSAEELMDILQLNMKRNDYSMTEDATKAAKQLFDNAIKNKDCNFGNGRYVRNVFEIALQNQATRLAEIPNITEELLTTITKEDIENIKK